MKGSRGYAGAGMDGVVSLHAVASQEQDWGGVGGAMQTLHSQCSTTLPRPPAPILVHLFKKKKVENP